MDRSWANQQYGVLHFWFYCGFEMQDIATSLKKAAIWKSHLILDSAIWKSYLILEQGLNLLFLSICRTERSGPSQGSLFCLFLLCLYLHNHVASSNKKPHKIVTLHTVLLYQTIMSNLTIFNFWWIAKVPNICKMNHGWKYLGWVFHKIVFLLVEKWK